MEKERMLSPVNIIAAILIAMLVISASVTITLFDRSAFARMQEKAGLPESTGLSEEEILANYNALIEYNSVFFTGPLVFPTFEMSESGRIHFEEVKAIFAALQTALIISVILSLLFGVLLLKKRKIMFIRLGGILSLVIPASIVLGMAIIGWDRFFVLFHRIFFNNDFWVFDYTTDPVILILPDAWFLNCLIRIIAGIVISAVILIAFPQTFEKILKFRDI